MGTSANTSSLGGNSDLLSLLEPVGIGLSAVSGIAGLFQSASARKQQQDQINQQRNFLDQTYLPDMNKRYLDTDQAQSFLGAMRDRLYTANQQAAQTNAITGGTDEAALAAREANAQTYTNALNQLASQGTAYQQGIQDRYVSGMNNIFGQQMGMDAQSAQSGSNIFSNSMNTMGNLAMMPLLKK